jgi:hypothetical protein
MDLKIAIPNLAMMDGSRADITMEMTLNVSPEQSEKILSGPPPALLQDIHEQIVLFAIMTPPANVDRTDYSPALSDKRYNAYALVEENGEISEVPIFQGAVTASEAGGEVHVQGLETETVTETQEAQTLSSAEPPASELDLPATQELATGSEPQADEGFVVIPSFPPYAAPAVTPAPGNVTPIIPLGEIQLPVDVCAPLINEPAPQVIEGTDAPVVETPAEVCVEVQAAEESSEEQSFVQPNHLEAALRRQAELEAQINRALATVATVAEESRLLLEQLKADQETLKGQLSRLQPMTIDQAVALVVAQLGSNEAMRRILALAS